MKRNRAAMKRMRRFVLLEVDESLTTGRKAVMRSYRDERQDETVRT